MPVILKTRGITKKFGGLTAVNQVDLILDLCCGVSPETTATAIEEMEAAGVNMIRNH